MKYRVKRIVCGVLCAALLLSFAACQQSPDSSIVVNKNMDALIEQATSGEDSGVLAQAFDTYKTTFTDDSFGVTVNVDAQVEIPQTDKMSVYCVKRRMIDNTFLDTVKKALIGETPLYDAEFLHVPTKKNYEKKIAEIKEGIQKGYALQNELELLLRDYETAPDFFERPQSPNDGTIQSVKEYYDLREKNEFTEELYRLNPKGEFYYGVNDGSNDEYISLYCMNDPDRGSYIVYRKQFDCYAALALREANHVNYINTSVIQQELLTDEGLKSLIKEKYRYPEGTEIGAYISPSDLCTISKEDAMRQADAFIQMTGLTEYSCFSADACTEANFFNASAANFYSDRDQWRAYYVLVYKRNIDGAFLNNEAIKGGDLPGDAAVTKLWFPEQVEFRINDNGIVGLDIQYPLEITETAVESAALRSFEDIKTGFEKMIVVTNASERTAGVLEIDRVRLSYARVSAKDDYDTGLLVPVWDFFGYNRLYQKESGIPEYDPVYEMSLLTINAIDQSIINQQLGY